MTKLEKRYSELIQLPTFKERFDYLCLQGKVGIDTFGSSRYLNQALYNSGPWRALRNKVIARDNGYDMGCEGYLCDRIIIHHINPITVEDFEDDNPLIWDLENLVCVDTMTHKAIHYSDFSLIKPVGIVTRSPYDTCPWRK